MNDIRSCSVSSSTAFLNTYRRATVEPLAARWLQLFGSRNTFFPFVYQCMVVAHTRSSPSEDNLFRNCLGDVRLQLQYLSAKTTSFLPNKHGGRNPSGRSWFRLHPLPLPLPPLKIDLKAKRMEEGQKKQRKVESRVFFLFLSSLPTSNSVGEEEPKTAANGLAGFQSPSPSLETLIMAPS